MRNLPYWLRLTLFAVCYLLPMALGSLVLRMPLADSPLLLLTLPLFIFLLWLFFPEDIRSPWEALRALWDHADDEDWDL